MKTDTQVLIFLFYASACTMHGSTIRPDPIPEKTIIVIMILTLCLALYISYPNFTLFMLMIFRFIKTCKGPIKISKGPLILVDFELKKVLLSPPPPLGNFADISYLKENFKPHLLRVVCTLCSGALVSDSLLHMLL